MRTIAWQARDDDGKYQIEARISGGQLEWRKRVARNQGAERYIPSADDWDSLENELLKRAHRGQICEKELALVKSLRIKS